MLEALLEAARQFISSGLPLSLLRIVAHPPASLTEAEREDYVVKLKRVFADAKRFGSVGKWSAGTGPREYSYDLFVSYSRFDRDPVDYFLEELTNARPSARVFLDRTEIDVGRAWQHEIFEALDVCWRVVSMFSPSYLESKVCLEELNIGLCRAREEDRPVVFPIYLYSARLPTYMRLANYVDCRECDREKIREASRRFADAIAASG
jgi:hypothetical protein